MVGNTNVWVNEKNLECLTHAFTLIFVFRDNISKIWLTEVTFKFGEVNWPWNERFGRRKKHEQKRRNEIFTHPEFTGARLC